MVLSAQTRCLWAKKSQRGDMLWLPLYVHLMDAAAVGGFLWNRWLPDSVKHFLQQNISRPKEAQQLLKFLLAAHDLGKATPVFQAKRARPLNVELDDILWEKQRAAGLACKREAEFAQPSASPHAFAGELLLSHFQCPRQIASIVGAHHGKPASSQMWAYHKIESYSENYGLEAGWQEPVMELVAFALDLAGYTTLEQLPLPTMAAQALYTALVVMADWIASSEEAFPYYAPDLEPSWEAVQARAERGWHIAGLPESLGPDNTWMYADLYQQRFGYAPNPMQVAAAKMAEEMDAPGLMVIEAPMGRGKTEAALVAAEILSYRHGANGIFFALPTQATSNAIFPRILEYVNAASQEGLRAIRLSHGKAQFNETYQALRLKGSGIGDDAPEGAAIYPWFEGSKKAILADDVVGTIDQFLMAALKQKYVMLRHLGLAKKVVILDECHAYDAYMSEYLKTALQWMGAYRVPVILLSATLPQATRQQLVNAYRLGIAPPKGADTENRMEEGRIPAYPLITCFDGKNILQQPVQEAGVTLRVLVADLDEAGLAAFLQEKLEGGGCIGLIVNTVKRAQRLYTALAPVLGEDVALLIHARYLAEDRAEQETRLLGELGKPGKAVRPQRRLVIGTQILEQSLDIDCDLLITELCPIDLLLQRIGRLHRHARQRPRPMEQARCYILRKEGRAYEKESTYIYSEHLLMRTEAFLHEELNLPEDIPGLVAQVYDEAFDMPTTPTGYADAQKKHERDMQERRRRASSFQLNKPQFGKTATLKDFLNTDIPAGERLGEAAVRDTDPSLEVLLIQYAGGQYRFLPHREGGRLLHANHVPIETEAKAMARQSIRLPREMCTLDKGAFKGRLAQTISQLEAYNRSHLALWQQSPWLRGQLFLALDDKLEASLNGFRLQYSQILGLSHIEEERPK